MRGIWQLLRLCLATSSLVGSLASGDEPVPVPEPDPIGGDAVRWPMMPEPAGPPSPRPVIDLAADRLYVVEWDKAFTIVSVPLGIVDVIPEAGPFTVFSRFADGSDKFEKRTYSGKYIYLVTAAAKGRVELVEVKDFTTPDKDRPRIFLNVMGARPPPIPIPPDPIPIPDPVDPPGPVDPVTGPLTILIIEETAARSTLPSSQLVVLTGKALRDYAKTHCSKAEDGTPNLRILDEDADASSAAVWIKQSFADPRAKVPWIIVSNGTAGFSGPLPITEAETITLLKKYGG